MKQPFGVAGGDGGDFLDRHAFDGGQRLRDERDVSRLVALAAMGHWSKIRTVGFEQDMVERDRFRHRPQRDGILERQDAGKADEKPQFDAVEGKLLVAAETMHHTPWPEVRLMSTQDFQQVDVGVPVVDDHRQPEFLRQGEMRPEQVFLLLLNGRNRDGCATGRGWWRERPACGGWQSVIIQPGLADGHNFWLPGQLPEFVHLPQPNRRHVAGMQADGGIDAGKLFGNRQRLTAVRQVGADGDDSFNASRAGAFDHGREFRRKLRPAQVSMGVSEHRVSKSARPVYHTPTVRQRIDDDSSQPRRHRVNFALLKKADLLHNAPCYEHALC